jgi:catechol-2,3-dioxygenase
MIDVRRMGAATFKTTDIDRSLSYFSDMLGLILVDSSASRAVLATAEGLEAIVLERGSEAGLAKLSFQVSPPDGLDAAASFLASKGIETKSARDLTPGVAKAIQFTDPLGTQIELFSDYAFAKRDKRQAGIMPLKVGHVAAVAPNVEPVVNFYRDCLGFRLSDWRPDAAYFLRCNTDHHTVNFFRNDKTTFHHLAFELNDWAELHRSCDFLARNGYKIEWGPSRHIIGHNIACYHRNADGFLIELFTELDQMKDETLGYFDPRPWHEDTPQRPKAWGPGTSSNYWGVHQIRADNAD